MTTDDAATAQARKAADFRALHEGEPFVIPNPWDAGSARVFEALGFKALATTSSAFAFTLGRLDGGVTLDELAVHVRSLAEATSLPVSVDLENGYGPDRRTPRARSPAPPRPVRSAARSRTSTRRATSTASSTRRRGSPPPAGPRTRSSFPFTLTARAENHIRGNPDLDDTIARLQAYERAGADVIYAPGLRNGDEIRAIADATSKPLNVLAHKGLSMQEIAEAGGTRVSVGGALGWVAVAAMASAAEEIRDTGSFASLNAKLPLEEWFGT